jgi:peroxin-4
MAAKRLLKELDQYNKDPSPAITHLEPTSEEDIFHLTAILRGPEGTAYEGKHLQYNHHHHHHHHN